MWSKRVLSLTLPIGVLMSLRVLNIDTPSLGDRSYLVHDGVTAALIDPQRDIDRVNDLLARQNLVLGAVFETHMHNDYLSGGLELSREHGVEYVISQGDLVKYKHLAVRDQQVVPVGTFALKAISTPGHTFSHTSYQLIDPGNSSVGVFTGGSLLHGATGRPDLLGSEHARELAGMQHQSSKLLAETLGDEVNLYPTHGFGSFCSATPTLTDSSTIGDQKRSNPVLLQSREEYIRNTLAALDAFPTYFKYMAPENMRGPGRVDLSAALDISLDVLIQAIQSGKWVVDLRSRVEWAKAHLPGSSSFGLDGSFASYLGWLHPHSDDLFLISDDPADLLNAQRELVRIGIDRPTGAFVAPTSRFPKSQTIRVASFIELADAMKISEVTILDVRQNLERQKSHIQFSTHIPFYEVQSRVNELPDSREIWVHCASGYRASTVLGFIEKSGRTCVLINDDYSKALSVKGLHIIES